MWFPTYSCWPAGWQMPDRSTVAPLKQASFALVVGPAMWPRATSPEGQHAALALSPLSDSVVQKCLLPRCLAPSPELALPPFSTLTWSCQCCLGAWWVVFNLTPKPWCAVKHFACGVLLTLLPAPANSALVVLRELVPCFAESKKVPPFPKEKADLALKSPHGAKCTLTRHLKV